MPRTKGSENRPKFTTESASQIAEKQEAMLPLLQRSLLIPPTSIL